MAPIRLFISFVAAFFFLLNFAQAAKEIEGASDHPQVGRYEGSIITFHQIKGYDETMLPRAAFTREDQDNPAAKSVSLAGRLTEIRYEGPADRSALEVVRNYQQALEANGFTTVFQCRQDSCGYNVGFWTAARGGVGLPSQWNDNTYVLAKKERPEGNIWVSVFAVEVKAYGARPLTPHVALRVVEEQPLETGKISLVTADKLAEAIGVNGRIALYGINFDHDSDVVNASSAPQIEEVAAYFAANPAAKALVVGHTDATGGLDYNRGLSSRRASAVVAALTGDHGVDANRLFAIGVGPAAPLATNRTEAGRAKNRRVEIVDLPSAE